MVIYKDKSPITITATISYKDGFKETIEFKSEYEIGHWLRVHRPYVKCLQYEDINEE